MALVQGLKLTGQGVFLLGQITVLSLGYNYVKNYENREKTIISDLINQSNSIKKTMENPDETGYYVTPNTWVSNEVGLLDHYYSNMKKKNATF